MENNSNQIIIKEQTSGCLGCLGMIIVPLIVAIGYFVVGTIIWFIPFILACLVIFIIGYFVLKGLYILLKAIFG